MHVKYFYDYFEKKLNELISILAQLHKIHIYVTRICVSHICVTHICFVFLQEKK